MFILSRSPQSHKGRKVAGNVTGLGSETCLEKRNQSLVYFDNGNTQGGCEVQSERGGFWKTHNVDVSLPPGLCPCCSTCV